MPGNEAGSANSRKKQALYPRIQGTTTIVCHGFRGTRGSTRSAHNTLLIGINNSNHIHRTQKKAALKPL